MIPPTIKVVSLNIEKNKHIDKVLAFLKQENPDVVCLQEIFRPDFERFKQELSLEGVFDYQVTLTESNVATYEQGVAILSKHPIISHQSKPYTNNEPTGESVNINNHAEKSVDKNVANKKYSRRVLFAFINIGNEVYNFATTHFTWGYYGYRDANGEFIWQIDRASTSEQESDAGRLLDIFAHMGEFVFCADTNCPRGQKVFGLFSQNLKDNIPQSYRTSIDGSIHRAGPLPLMVDCLFTTPGYIAENVTLKDGVSDHMAVVGEIRKI